ncbi:MAG: hypothetical protein EAZ78_28420 [Oscillatoriales cyanobacterium]|nr:MAG: hypothetical protein EAZ78_28420 [Oscillatoriales cyanobacterium]
MFGVMWKEMLCWLMELFAIADMGVNLVLGERNFTFILRRGYSAWQTRYEDYLRKSLMIFSRLMITIIIKS